jgi:hypothetical protein
MTARKWGNALESVEISPLEEVKILRELLVKKGVIAKKEIEDAKTLPSRR